jgi:hypothetical protein
MQLKYYVPFKAQTGVDAQLAIKERLLNIEGAAIDTSVNSNKWQVPQEDLDFFVATLKDAQLRIDHAESAMAVIGKVPEASRVGDTAIFRAEIGDLAIIEKVLRGYLTHVSVQVDSDDVECSKCLRQTRKEGILVHLCPGAWEIVHKPKVRELSIVASPAYKNTEFKPVGFAAAMDASQMLTREAMLSDITGHIEGIRKSILQLHKVTDEGSKGDLQEPDKKTSVEQTEEKHLSEENKADASLKAQTVVNTAAEGSKADALPDDYSTYLNQLQDLANKMKTADDAALKDIQAKLADLEAKIGRSATKTSLTQKINELSRKLSKQIPQQEGEPNEEGAEENAEEGAEESAEEAKAKGKGMVATGPNAGGSIPAEAIVGEDGVPKDSAWFMEIFKAYKKQKGFRA